ncbi:HNH endonuclease [Paenibacillus agricola]|uniref:HNH endonuclease n=1 Tax=Paenibacillus agricola TaxID=2716264 RepID=A0ABX0J5S2_9BACL|nr:HNH endonuclease signature motif containing protein [Paenibacillus agricola]NHN31146.1 HNH endonuclease [Paenibacillus agricola]
MTYSFDIETDYKLAFMVAVSSLVSAVITPRSDRVLAVSALIDAYVRDIGKAPDSAQLERLADALLYEELTDPDPYKVAHEDRPILGDFQFVSRRKREVPLEYVSEVTGCSVDTLFYDTPELRLQSEIDIESERYHGINRSQPVVAYNLRDQMGEDTFRAAYPITPPHPYALFRGIEHAEWSLCVRKRDKFTCQKCGKRGPKGMQAHHIESYNTALDLRYDEHNGITLCKSCHSEFHSIYGKGHNTRIQLNEWMGGHYYEL